MQPYIVERVKACAQHIISTGDTVRKTAQVMGVSKSTVHQDMTERLKKLNPKMSEKVYEIIKKNKAERHLRGGMATQEKYKNKKGVGDDR